MFPYQRLLGAGTTTAGWLEGGKTAAKSEIVRGRSGKFYPPAGGVFLKLMAVLSM